MKKSASKSNSKDSFLQKYLKLDQEVPYPVVENLLVHPVLVESHETER
jgi:hypothetical protein